MEETWKEEWARAGVRVEERRRALQRVEVQRGRVQELQQRCEELRRTLAMEQADVEALRRLGFRGLLVRLTGDRERRLEAEERDVFEAQVRLQDAMAELGRREDKLRETEAAAAALDGAEAERDELVRAREQAVIAAGGGRGEELTKLAEREGRLVAELEEVQEARLSGSDASDVLDEAVAELERAASWGVLDLVGGGLIVTHVKHRRIDAARESFAEAGEALWDFERELRDVVVFDVPELELEGLHVGLDYLLDGLLIDAFVQSRVQRARKNAEATRDQVERVLAKLDGRHATIEAELAEVRERRIQLVTSSS